jgi:hypothetical protein
MGRERWFYGQNLQRRGPVPLTQLVEAVLAQTDPRATLVWRKGFAEWTRAEDVPEVERRIAPYLARKEAEAAARRPPPPPAAPPATVYVPTPAARPASPLLYGGIGAAVILVLGVGAWLMWPRPQPTIPPQLVPLGGETTESAPAVVIPAPGSTPVATPTPSAPPPVAATPKPVAVATPVPTPTPVPAGVGNREAELPPSEVKKLRGVAAWSGTTLRLTVYNGTAWRVTALYVKIGRFSGDQFKEDDRPVLLLPPARNVDTGVADLLSKVAPDRKKPGLNPLDTGPFEGEAGAQPESFRFEIESARGYPPA